MAKFTAIFKDKLNNNIKHETVDADNLKGAVQKLGGPDVTPWPTNATQVDVRELTV